MAKYLPSHEEVGTDVDSVYYEFKHHLTMEDPSMLEHLVMERLAMNLPSLESDAVLFRHIEKEEQRKLLLGEPEYVYTPMEPFTGSIEDGLREKLRLQELKIELLQREREDDRELIARIEATTGGKARRTPLTDKIAQQRTSIAVLKIALEEADNAQKRESKLRMEEMQKANEREEEAQNAITLLRINLSELRNTASDLKELRKKYSKLSKRFTAKKETVSHVRDDLDTHLDTIEQQNEEIESLKSRLLFYETVEEDRKRKELELDQKLKDIEVKDKALYVYGKLNDALEVRLADLQLRFENYQKSQEVPMPVIPRSRINRDLPEIEKRVDDAIEGAHKFNEILTQKLRSIEDRLVKRVGKDGGVLEEKPLSQYLEGNRPFFLIEEGDLPLSGPGKGNNNNGPLVSHSRILDRVGTLIRSMYYGTLPGDKHPQNGASRLHLTFFTRNGTKQVELFVNDLEPKLMGDQIRLVTDFMSGTKYEYMGLLPTDLIQREGSLSIEVYGREGGGEPRRYNLDYSLKTETEPPQGVSSVVSFPGGVQLYVTYVTYGIYKLDMLVVPFE